MEKITCKMCRAGYVMRSLVRETAIESGASEADACQHAFECYPVGSVVAQQRALEDLQAKEANAMAYLPDSAYADAADVCESCHRQQDDEVQAEIALTNHDIALGNGWEHLDEAQHWIQEAANRKTAKDAAGLLLHAADEAARAAKILRKLALSLS